MTEKKLQLDDLKVESFVTILKDRSGAAVKGGLRKATDEIGSECCSCYCNTQGYCPNETEICD